MYRAFIHLPLELTKVKREYTFLFVSSLRVSDSLALLFGYDADGLRTFERDFINSLYRMCIG